MSSIDLTKHFEAADREKSGRIDFHGLQLMIQSIGKFDAFIVREFVHAINNNKEKKCSLAELQSKVDSVKSSSMTAAPLLKTAIPPSVGRPDGAFTVPEILSGSWINELHSKMYIFPTSAVEGQFEGMYETIVGQASGWYPIVGRYDPAPTSGFGRTMGWTNQWNNDVFGNTHSNTTWSGQYYETSTGKQVILTTWLLTSQKTFEENWSATLVGKDEFVKLL